MLSPEDAYTSTLEALKMGYSLIDNIKMSNWSTEKTKRAPRTKSIQAPNGDN